MSHDLVVTEEMAIVFRIDYSYIYSGNDDKDMQKTLQSFVDRHSIKPKSGLDKAELLKLVEEAWTEALNADRRGGLNFEQWSAQHPILKEPTAFIPDPRGSLVTG